MSLNSFPQVKSVTGKLYPHLYLDPQAFKLFHLLFSRGTVEGEWESGGVSIWQPTEISPPQSNYMDLIFHMTTQVLYVVVSHCPSLWGSLSKEEGSCWGREKLLQEGIAGQPELGQQHWGSQQNAGSTASHGQLCHKAQHWHSPVSAVAERQMGFKRA